MSVETMAVTEPVAGNRDRSPECVVTREARAYMAQNGLSDALSTTLRLIDDTLVARNVHVSLATYDDLSDVRSVKVVVVSGLCGKDAVAKEDEILDGMMDEMDMETVNAFLVIVR